MLIPDNFFEVEFSKAMAFGYKTEEVDEYLSKAWEIIRAQQQELSTLQEKMEVLAGSLEKYREDEESLRSAIIGAQKLGDSILKDSKNKAEMIRRDANIEARHIVEDAHVQLENEKAEYARLKAEVTAFRENLIGMYKTHLEQITKIPHFPVKAAADAAPEQAPDPIPKEQLQTTNPEPVREEPDAAEYEREESAAEVSKEAVQPVPEPEEEHSEPEESTAQPVLTIMEDPDEAEPEDDALKLLNHKMRRISYEQPVQSEQKNIHINSLLEDDEEQDGNDGPYIQPRKSVVSPKYGVLKFGDNFDLSKDEKSEAASRK